MRQYIGAARAAERESKENMIIIMAFSYVYTRPITGGCGL